MDRLTSLFRNASLGDYKKIIELISTGYYTSNNINRALNIACEYGHLDILLMDILMITKTNQCV
jgi:hypothetical protein